MELFAYKPSAHDLYTFFRHFAAYVGSGNDLTTTLSDLAENAPHEKMAEEILRILTAVERDGDRLGDAFARSGFWPEFVAQTIRAGEESGKLEAIMKEIANHLKQQGDVQRKVSQALLTPKIVSFFLFAGFCILAGVIVPRFETMYAMQKLPLPWFTRVVFGLVNFVAGYWYLLLALVVGAWFAWKKFLDSNQELVDGWKLKLPIFKTVYYYLLQYRFTKMTALLYLSGQSIPNAFNYTAKIVDNVVYGKILETAARKIVAEGTTAANALREANHDKIIDYIAIAFLATGEKNGKIDEQLAGAAADYEDVIRVNIERFSTLISVLALLPMALAITGLYIAVLAPQIGLFTR